MPGQWMLEEIDPITNCVAASWNVAAADLVAVAEQLDIVLVENAGIAYDLSEPEMTTLMTALGIAPNGQRPGRIRSRTAMDDLPYKVHTGRELALMLAGTKPMAYFAYFDGESPSVAIDQPFEAQVATGTLRRHSHTIRRSATTGAQGVNYVIYTVPEEEWRAPALVMLLEAGQKSGWSAGMERLEGMLLGYNDEQNDAFQQWRAKHRAE